MDTPCEVVRHPYTAIADVCVTPMAGHEFEQQCRETVFAEIATIQETRTHRQQVPRHFSHGVLEMFGPEPQDCHVGALRNRDRHRMLTERFLIAHSPPPASHSVILRSLIFGATISNSRCSSAPIGGSG